MDTQKKPAAGGIRSAGSGLASPAKSSTVVTIPTERAQRALLIGLLIKAAAWCFKHRRHDDAREWLRLARKEREAP